MKVKLSEFQKQISRSDQKAGRECGQHANYFLQSVREAEAFITAKCNKGDVNSPTDIMWLSHDHIQN